MAICPSTGLDIARPRRRCRPYPETPHRWGGVAPPSGGNPVSAHLRRCLNSNTPYKSRETRRPTGHLQRDASVRRHPNTGFAIRDCSPLSFRSGRRGFPVNIRGIYKLYRKLFGISNRIHIRGIANPPRDSARAGEGGGDTSRKDRRR